MFRCSWRASSEGLSLIQVDAALSRVSFLCSCGNLVYVTKDEMVEMFRFARAGTAGSDGKGGNEQSKGGGIRLVFVSACFSESVADVFVSAGVPHVVAVSRSTKVLDHKAQDFAHSFYTALLRGDTVRQAFDIGRARRVHVHTGLFAPRHCFMY